MHYPALRLKKGRDKSVRNYHPWIFSGAVESVGRVQDGGIVSVVDENSNLLGHGFYDKNSQIACRIFHFGELPDDFESAGFWRAKLENAFSLRRELIAPEETNCYRLIHAEGDNFPGLIADAYHDVAVLQFLILSAYRLSEKILPVIKEWGFEKIYIKNAPGLESGQWTSGSGGGLTEAIENGMRFFVDVEGGQKTGFFIDQRENRRLVSSFSRGKNVLNLFSYTGGFSVAALSGGASRVLSVDISQPAIELCERNVRLNFPDAAHQSATADCFQYLRQTGEHFDLIVIDPPAFAKHKGAVNQAARGYKDLNMIAMKKIAPQGLIFTFSCSQHISPDLFQKIIFGAAADAGRKVRMIKRLQQPGDHPVNIFHPEGEYLKGLALWVE